MSRGLNSEGQVCVRLGTSAEKQQKGSSLLKTWHPAQKTLPSVTAVGFIFSVESPVPLRPRDRQTGEPCAACK